MIKTRKKNKVGDWWLVQTETIVYLEEWVLFVNVVMQAANHVPNPQQTVQPVLMATAAPPCRVPAIQ
jgi:hypothetical protein